ncbi:MAG: hypothetical protein ACI8XB_001732 [Patiriisocius sp.]|jgi:hypothetical protein
MKKILFSIVALGLVMTGFAQQKANLEAASVAPNKINKKIETNHFEKGAAIFSDDFSNGLGAWTAVDSEGYGIWHLATAASPEGEFSTNIGQLQSTTASNGWMIFDCDGFNTDVNQTGTTGIASDVQGFLTTPSIDMTDEPSVILEFQQYFRYCCFGTSPMSVQVSSDGGGSWTTFASNDYFIESANAASDNAMTTTMDISCAAGGEADVMVRFAYNAEFDAGYSHYYWGVDDVSIYGNANVNDMAIDLVTNGDIWNNYEYRVTALEQAVSAADGGLLIGTYFNNYGTANQTNVTLTVEILDDAGTVLNTNVSDAFNSLTFANSAICPASTDSIYIETGWEPTVEGTYIIRSTLVSADATDDVPADNIVEKSIEYTTVQMGHDDATAFDLEMLQSTAANGDFETEGFGNHYQMTNEDSEAFGVIVYFGPNTTPGLTIEARLNTTDGFVSVDDDYEFIDYEIQPEDVPTSMADPIATYIEFEDTYELLTIDDGATYFALVTIQELGEGELTVLANANADSDFSTGEIDLSGGGDFVWFNRPDVPAVRLALEEPPLGLEELTLSDGVSNFENSPNPATDITTISYSLVEKLDITIEVVDMNGKVVHSAVQGSQNTGDYRFELNVSEYSDGVYFYSLISGNKKMTRKMVVTK